MRASLTFTASINRGDAYDPEVFRDREGYDKLVSNLEEQYVKKIRQ